MAETEKEVPEKISDQAILMLKLREMAQLSRQADTVPIFRAPAGNATNEGIKNKTRRFNNLCILDYEYPYAIPNIILSHDQESSAMLKLTTLQLSMLIPRIRIFKTVFDLNLEEELNIELPFDDVANKSDIEKIFQDRSGRGTGCGLKNFEWKSLGKNQANLAQFSAKMELYLLNIQEIIQLRNSSTLPNGRTINVSILDLLYQKPDLRSGFNEGSNIYDPKYFGIKVEVGWHINDSLKDEFRNESRRYGDDPEKVLSIILKQKSIFYLTLVSHNLDFQPDGSVNLSIDYIASAEIDASDNVLANVLKLPSEEEVKLQQALQKSKDVNRQLNSLKVAKSKTDESLKALAESNEDLYVKWLKDGHKGTYSEYVDKNYRILSPEESATIAEFQRLKEEKDLADKELEQMKRSFKVDRMSSIIKGLNDKNLINSMCISQEDLETLTSLRSNFVETTDDLEKVKQDFNTIKLNLKIVPNNSLDLSAIESLKKTSESGDVSQSKAQSSLDAASLGDPRLCPDKSTQISFFFFGDLLNTVLENIFNEDATKLNDFTTKTTRVMLGPITYYDFGSIEDNSLIIRTRGTKDKDGELVAVYRGKQTIVNMADIPISVREFQRWFTNNIINKGRETYSFWDFSKDLIDDLLISAIASETYKFAPKQQVRINMLPFSAPKLPHNEELFEEILGNRDRIKSFRFNLNAGSNFNGRTLMPFLNSNLKADKQNYILFYGTNQPPLERIADERKDLEQKIYHVYIGEERGIVVQPSFSRDDNPRQRATNIQQSNPEKQQDGMIIREKYSARIRMFGNFLFLPGQQIFVHPTYPGMNGQNVRENVLLKLGLGGYYRVIETNSRIASGEFTTELITKWDAFGDGTLNIGDQLVGQVVNKELLMREDSELGQSVLGQPDRVKLVAE